MTGFSWSVTVATLLKGPAALQGAAASWRDPALAGQRNSPLVPRPVRGANGGVSVRTPRPSDPQASAAVARPTACARDRGSERSGTHHSPHPGELELPHSQSTPGTSGPGGLARQSAIKMAHRVLDEASASAFASKTPGGRAAPGIRQQLSPFGLPIKQLLSAVGVAPGTRQQLFLRGMPILQLLGASTELRVVDSTLA
jgi:hypothetical protein